MERKIIATGAFFGMTAVILGAFGAHKLRQLLEPEMLSAFETGVRYQMYHAFLLLFVGIYPVISDKSRTAIFWLATIGIALFSGSIYLLSTGKISGVDFKSIGLITPLGGLLLIAAWAVLMVNFMSKKS
jgi:uncharacterized membrane protein YgdD (TMEM256/DUF423 family)